MTTCERIGMALKHVCTICAVGTIGAGLLVGAGLDPCEIDRS